MNQFQRTAVQWCLEYVAILFSSACLYAPSLPNRRYFSRFQTVTPEASEGKHEATKEHHTRATGKAQKT